MVPDVGIGKAGRLVAPAERGRKMEELAKRLEDLVIAFSKNEGFISFYSSFGGSTSSIHLSDKAFKHLFRGQAVTRRERDPKTNELSTMIGLVRVFCLEDTGFVSKAQEVIL